MGREGEGGAEEKASAAGTTWLHCSVGPQLKDGEVEDGKVQVRVLCVPPWYLAATLGSSRAGVDMDMGGLMRNRACVL